ARQKEMAVRVALGAGPWRLMRQLFTESLLLAACGAAAGLGLAHVAQPMIDSIHPLPRATEIELDSRVLMFTMAAAVVTGLLFGLAPACRAGRPDLNHVLKGTARGATGDRGQLR